MDTEAHRGCTIDWTNIFRPIKSPLHLFISSPLHLFIRLSLLLLALHGVGLAADEAPEWLRQAAASNVPSFDRNVPAVVLLNERNVKVESSGKVTTTERLVLRVLTLEGRREARGSLTYTTDTGRVKEMRGWVLRRNEEVRKYGRAQTLDTAAALNDVFNEVRVKLINASGDVSPGETFGYESVLEDRSVFTQFDWLFQNRLPTRVSRFSITLPMDWQVESLVFNHAPIEPSVVSGEARTLTWEVNDLPFLEEEPASPPVTSLAPRLALSYFPPTESRAKAGRAFADWAEVSRWLAELSDPQAVVSEPLAKKARELVAEARSELEKIRAIGRYCQSVNYVSIQTGTGRGGGYRPHAAAEVFKKAYGDCKDKANLMRTMLAVVGIRADLLSIYAGDREYVRETFPSPQQFNHCIVAVRVSEQTEAAAVVEHPAFGRLLIFDPTDEHTPVGDLPATEQGSFALLIAAAGGELLRLPVISAESNRLERLIEAQIGADGGLAAQVSEQTSGQTAVDFRREFRELSPAEYVKWVERWLARSASNINLRKVEPTDAGREGRFTLRVEFAAPQYAQAMSDGLLLFKPAILSRRQSLFFPAAARKTPVRLEAQAYSEEVRVRLPQGFVVDELPETVKLNASFGSYTTDYEVRDAQLYLRRRLEVRPVTVPVAAYATVRDFFAAVRAAEDAIVVLSKK